jgi:hypothetical protein
MLTCRDVVNSATDYMERKLSLRQRLQVRMHLLMCRFCRRYLRQLALTRAVLRRLPPPLPSDEALDRVLQIFRSRSRSAGNDSR